MVLDIITAAVALALMGGIFGIILAFASKIFEVKVDERVPAVLLCLPGANCGACGCAGCEAYAKAIVRDGAKIDKCTVDGGDVVRKIAEIMGQAADGKKINMRATVRCCGADSATVKKYEYAGTPDCDAAARLAGGEKMCVHSCVGFGNCVNACRFGALELIGGVAVVNKERCTGCGMCLPACPKNLITLIPEKSKFFVGCLSVEKGADTVKACQAGCTGCRLCEKACEYDAIHVTNNCAKFDYDKCINCGACEEKCPRGIIRFTDGTVDY